MVLTMSNYNYFSYYSRPLILLLPLYKLPTLSPVLCSTDVRSFRNYRSYFRHWTGKVTGNRPTGNASIDTGQHNQLSEFTKPVLKAIRSSVGQKLIIGEKNLKKNNKIFISSCKVLVEFPDLISCSCKRREANMRNIHAIFVRF
jgi:hypothetical protein